MVRKKPFIPKEWRVSQQPHVGLSCARMTTGVVPGSDNSDSRDESARKAFLEKFTQGRYAQGRRRDSWSLAESLASPFPFNRGLSLAGTQVRCLAQDSSPASGAPGSALSAPLGAGGGGWHWAGRELRAKVLEHPGTRCVCVPVFHGSSRPLGNLPAFSLCQRQVHQQDPVRAQLGGPGAAHPHGARADPRRCAPVSVPRPASTPPPIPMPPGCPDTRWEQESREEQ